MKTATIIITKCFSGPLFFSISLRAFFSGVGVLGTACSSARRDLGVLGCAPGSQGVEVWLWGSWLGANNPRGGWTGVEDCVTGIPPPPKTPPWMGVEVMVPSSKDRLGLLRNWEGLKGMLVLTGDIFCGVVRRDSLGSWGKKYFFHHQGLL